MDSNQYLEKMNTITNFIWIRDFLFNLATNTRNLSCSCCIDNIFGSRIIENEFADIWVTLRTATNKLATDFADDKPTLGYQLQWFCDCRPKVAQIDVLPWNDAWIWVMGCVILWCAINTGHILVSPIASLPLA